MSSYEGIVRESLSSYLDDKNAWPSSQSSSSSSNVNHSPNNDYSNIGAYRNVSTGNNNNHDNNFNLRKTLTSSAKSVLKNRNLDANRLQKDADLSQNDNSNPQQLMDSGSYSTALSLTIAIGSLFLILNVLIFVGIFYQKNKTQPDNSSEYTNNSNNNNNSSDNYQHSSTNNKVS